DRARDAKAKEITVEIDAEANANVVGDAALLRRVIDNLYDNALSYTARSGKIGLAAVVREGAVELSVSNTGHPIPLADRQRIFEKFDQRGESTRPFGNVGLGLYFARVVAEAHGATIRVVESATWPTSFVLR